MGIRNKLITKALLGLVIGMIVGVAFWIWAGPSAGKAGNFALILHLAVSGVLGMVCMGGSVVYDIESWGVLRVTFIHYFLCMASFLTASTLLEWFDSWQSLIIMLVIMTVMYAGIWVCEMLYWKRTVSGLNEQLKSIQK